MKSTPDPITAATRTLAVLMISGSFLLLAEEGPQGPGDGGRITLAEAASPATRERSVHDSGPLRVSGASREVVQMHRSGVAAEVILAFIQDSGRSFYVPPTEILELTRGGVPDPLIVAMIRQGAKSATATTRAAPIPSATPLNPAPSQTSAVTTTTTTTTASASTSAPPPVPPVSTEPIWATGSPRPTVVYEVAPAGTTADPYLSPWENGRYGHYPYSYYRRYHCSSWDYPRPRGAEFCYSGPASWGHSCDACVRVSGPVVVRGGFYGRAGYRYSP